MGFQVTHHGKPIGPVHTNFSDALALKGQSIKNQGRRFGTTVAWQIVSVDSESAEAPAEVPAER